MKVKFIDQKYSKSKSGFFGKFYKKIPNGIWFIITLFLITRILLTFSGILSRNVLHGAYESWYEWQYDKRQWLDIWSVWDSGWYLDIAQNGYSPLLKSDLPKKTCCGQSNVVFYPLYPLGIRLFGKAVGSLHLGGILLSNISFLVASVFFYKLVSEKFNEEVAKKSTLFLYLFPTSYFFSTVLTEGLFFLAVVLSFYFAYKKKWLASSISGFFAALTRSVGILTLVPLLIIFITEKIRSKKKIDLKILYFALMLTAPVIFMIYINHITGNPVYSFIVERSGWGHALVNPVSYLLGFILFSNPILSYFGLLTLFEIILIIYSAKKIGLSLTAYSLIFLIFPLFSGGETILAMPRFSSVVFPIYISVALLVKSRLSLFLLSTFLFSLQIISMFFWNLGLFGY